jgi:hypothetical protein
MSTEFEIFPGKNLSGLFKDIYDNQTSKKERISGLISEIKKMIQHKGDVGMLGPLIKDLIDSSIKNDDQLVKLASIAQKIITADKKTEGQDGFLTDEEKAQLLNDLEDTKNEVEKIDELGIELEEIKKKLK